MTINSQTLPQVEGLSGSATNATLTLTMGPSDSLGSTLIKGLQLSVIGGTTSVKFTLTGLQNTYKDGSTASQLSFTLAPNVSIFIPCFDPIKGLSQVTLTAIAAAGQTASAAFIGNFE